MFQSLQILCQRRQILQRHEIPVMKLHNSSKLRNSLQYWLWVTAHASEDVASLPLREIRPPLIVAIGYIIAIYQLFPDRMLLETARARWREGQHGCCPPCTRC